jgi:hypothetical protein
MVKALRVITSSECIYVDVDILDIKDQKDMGIPNYFEDAQFVFKSKGQGIIVIPSYNVKLVHFKIKPKQIPKEYGRQVRRISITGDITHQNPYLLNPGKSRVVGLPFIFNRMEQFVFTSSEGVFITTDSNVALVEW